jgi:hypothetical protein
MHQHLGKLIIHEGRGGMDMHCDNEALEGPKKI